MKARIRSVPYYYARVEGDPDHAYTWLEELASAEVDLLAFSALPYGPNHVEVTLFPVDKKALEQSAMVRGANLVGPYRAFLIQGDDRLGALADIHKELREAGVKVYASTGVTDGDGRFGYIVYVRELDFEAAASVLDLEGTVG